MADLQPDTIIMEQAEDASQLGEETMEILDTCGWEPRVVRLSLQDNELWLYQRHRQTISTTDELQELVRG